MLPRNVVLTGVAALTTVALACSHQNESITSPTSAAATSTGVSSAASIGSEGQAAAADGSTLKATPPTPQSPVNGVKPDTPQVTLVIANSSMKFGGSLPLMYRFEVYNAAGVRVYQSGLVAPGSGTTSHVVTGALDAEQPHTWQARAEYQGYVGPWSARASFIAPVSTGYIRGNELYDPLINGKTIGEIHGPTHFIPGVGISMDSLDSYVSYQLQQTLTEGEMSILATNVRTNTEGGKTKVMAMAEGYDDITTNNRRLTVEKRSDGSMAFRMITHDDQIDTSSAERKKVKFNLTDTFFFGFSYRANNFNLTVKQGGADGSTVFDLTKHWNGRPYDPNPHVVYIGGPGGRASQ
jgi:hypothetical protein